MPFDVRPCAQEPETGQLWNFGALHLVWLHQLGRTVDVQTCLIPPYSRQRINDKHLLFKEFVKVGKSAWFALFKCDVLIADDQYGTKYMLRKMVWHRSPSPRQTTGNGDPSLHLTERSIGLSNLDFRKLTYPIKMFWNRPRCILSTRDTAPITSCCGPIAGRFWWGRKRHYARSMALHGTVMLCVCFRQLTHLLGRRHLIGNTSTGFQIPSFHFSNNFPLMGLMPKPSIEPQLVFKR